MARLRERGELKRGAALAILSDSTKEVVVVTTALGVFLGLLILSSAAAHGLLGWPPLREALDGAQVESGFVGALAAGWYFGSVSMAGFGMIVLHQSLRRIRRQPIHAGPLWAIAMVYLTYGVGAYVARDFRPHFLLFIATGAFVALFSILGTQNAHNVDAA